jgi:hypothetical protein
MSQINIAEGHLCAVGHPARDRISASLISSPMTSSTSASGASTPSVLQRSKGGYEDVPLPVLELLGGCLTKAVQLCDHMLCMVTSRPVSPAATAATNDHSAGSRLWASRFQKSSCIW